MRTDPYLGLSSEEKQLLLERANRYARVAESAVDETTEAVSFKRGDDEFALPLTSLREIRVLRKPCPIPGASRAVPAIFHHRGEILSAHDLSAFLHGAPADARPEFAMIVDDSGRRLALIADELVGVVAVSAGRLVSLPVTLGDRANCFAGVTGDGILVLRPSALFESPALFNAF